jgi:hypothetical protein
MAFKKTKANLKWLSRFKEAAIVTNNDILCFYI